MELKDFINNGMLELYLMGLLSPEEVSLVERMRSQYPEINSELAKIEDFIEKDAIRNAESLPEQIDKKMELIFEGLEAEKNMQLSLLPLISAFSNSDYWLKLVSPLLPKIHSGERFEKLLRHGNGVMQVLVRSSSDIEEEIHDHLDESFLILEGTCICTIGNSSFNMGPGDFMQIPLYQPHTVSITSASVTAILQHVECAG